MGCFYLREGPDINFHVAFHCPIKFETYFPNHLQKDPLKPYHTEEKTWNCMKQSAKLYRVAQLVIRPGNNGYAGSTLRDTIISKAL